MATEAEVILVMVYLATAYPRAEIADATVAVYVMQLMRAGLPADALLLAAMNLIDTSQWMPTVAELRAEAQRIVDKRNGWYVTANYRLHGHPLPPELCLPYEMDHYARIVLEAAPVGQKLLDAAAVCQLEEG